MHCWLMEAGAMAMMVIVVNCSACNKEMLIILGNVVGIDSGGGRW